MHTPFDYSIWQAHNLRGKIAEAPWRNPGRPGGELTIVSSSKFKRAKWRCEFYYTADAQQANLLGYDTREQAWEKAELHREQMNYDYNSATAYWRYVKPCHVEVRFPTHPDSTVIMERAYWETVRHTCCFRIHSYKNKRKPTTNFLEIVGRDPESRRKVYTTVAAHRLARERGTRIKYIDGDRLHLCLENITVAKTKAKSS